MSNDNSNSGNGSLGQPYFHPKFTDEMKERLFGQAKRALEFDRQAREEMMAKSRDEFIDALNASRFDQAQRMLDAGFDINARAADGATVLQDIISHWDQPADRCEVVRFLLDHGADPRLLDNESGGPLFSAVIAPHEGALRLLLEAGADPNREHDGTESLYDWAEFDYRFEAYDGCHYPIPEKPTAEDQANEDAWLEFLDRVAIKHGRPRPTILRLLRQYGAKTTAELKGHR